MLEYNRSELQVKNCNENGKLGIGIGISILLSPRKRKECMGRNDESILMFDDSQLYSGMELIICKILIMYMTKEHNQGLIFNFGIQISDKSFISIHTQMLLRHALYLIF